MSNINPIQTGDEKREDILEDSELTAHRQFLKEISAKVAGRRPVNRDEGVYVFYRVPSYQLMQDEKRLRETPFGTFILDDGNIRFESEGTELPIQVLGRDPKTGLEFVNRVRHIAESKRQRLAAEANEDMEVNGETDRSTPKGPKGHLLKMYSRLLDQLENEHFRQRDRLQG